MGLKKRHTSNEIGSVIDNRLAAKTQQEQASIPMGLICMCVGLFLILVGQEVIPVSRSSVHVPIWIISVIGAAFACGGVAVIFNTRELSNFRFIGSIFGFFTFVLMMALLVYFVYFLPGIPMIVQVGVGLSIAFFGGLAILSYIPGSGVRRVQDGRTMGQRLEDKRRNIGKFDKL